MTDRDTSAFPLQITGPGGITADFHFGMTLRDYFAGQVLLGLYLDGSALAKLLARSNAQNVQISISEAAYDQADEMMRERAIDFSEEPPDG